MEDAKEGRSRSPSSSWFPAWDTLPRAATSQRHESNFGDALKHRADRIFQWEIRRPNRALKSRPQGGRKQKEAAPQARGFFLQTMIIKNESV